MDELISQFYSDFDKDADEFFLSNDLWLNLSNQKSIPIARTFDLFFTRLAYMYNQGLLNYEFCDLFINAAYQEWVFSFQDKNSKTAEFPPKFWEVYEAFDAGEYHRKDDKSDDPIAEYTDLLIREFLIKNDIAV